MNTAQLQENNLIDIRYALAGWLAIASACLFLPLFVLSLAHDIKKIATLLPFIVLMAGLQTAFSVYAAYQFRNLLNEYYDFHELDTLIMILIIAQIVITCIAMIGRIFPVLQIPMAITLAALAIPTSIVGIMFGIRLLHLNAPLHGLLKPLAYLSIAGAICMMTFILIPVAMLIFAITDVLLGVIFLKGKEEVRVDFV